METYTPIPDEALRRAPRPVRVGGWVAVAAVLLLVAVPFAKYTFNIGMPPDFHYYGTIETRFGTMGVFCGGDGGTPCGDGTTLELAQCTDPAQSYFDADIGTDRDAFVDAQARALTGERPPTGGRWQYYCGNRAMVRGGPANLSDN